jgi:hypothetical protein
MHPALRAELMKRNWNRAKSKNSCDSNSLTKENTVAETDGAIDHSVYSSDTVEVTKVCPKCKEIVRTHVEVCPDCGYVFENVPPPPQKAITNSNALTETVNCSQESNELVQKPKSVKVKPKNHKHTHKKNQNRRNKLTEEQSETQRQKREEKKQKALERIELLKRTAEIRTLEKEQRKQRKEQEEKAKQQRREFRLVSQAIKRAAFNQLQSHRRKYLADFTKEFPRMRVRGKDEVSYDYLSAISNEVTDPTFSEGCTYEIYERRNGTPVRVFMGADHKTYQQQQSKRDAEKWNKPIEQSLGITETEIIRFLESGLYGFPLSFGTNKPLGSQFKYGNVRDARTLKILANSEKEYETKLARALDSIERNFNIRKCDDVSPHNMAIVCTNITVIDFDDFWSNTTQCYVKKLIKEIGKFDKALVVFTPGGETHGPGVHLYFSMCEGLKSNSPVPGAIDIKTGSTSYVCAPGSVRENGCYRALDRRWIEEHGEEKYNQLLELLPVNEVILLDDYRNVDQLGEITSMQKSGIQRIIDFHYTGDCFQDLEYDDLTEDYQATQTGRAMLRHEIKNAGWGSKYCTIARLARSDKESTPKSKNDTNKANSESEKPICTKKVKLPKSTNKAAQNPEIHILESPDFIEEAVQKLFACSRAAKYEQMQKIWLDPEIDRQSIHPGWRQFFYSPIELIGNPDANEVDKQYLLWKTIAASIPVGYRNVALTSFAGVLCRECVQLPTLEVLIKTMLLYNSHLKIPLSQKEVEKISRSIHRRSLAKRDGDPDKVFESKPRENHHIENIKTKYQNIKHSIEKDIADPHKKELYLRTLLVVATGRWDLQNGEFDLTTFKQIVNRDIEDSDSKSHTKPTHSDGQTIIAALRTIIKQFCGVSIDKFKSKIQNVYYDDDSKERHSVIVGVSFVYDSQSRALLQNIKKETETAQDPYNPFGCCVGLFKSNGFFGNAIVADTAKSSNCIETISNEGNNKVRNREKENNREKKRLVFRIRREFFDESNFRSFVSYVEYRFCCDFDFGFRQALTKQLAV